MLEPGTAAVFISQLESRFALDSCHWKHPKAEKSLKTSSYSWSAFSLGSLWSSWMDEIGSEMDWCFLQTLSDLPAERDLWVEQWSCKRIPWQSGWIWLLELALRRQPHQGSCLECLGPEPYIHKVWLGNPFALTLVIFVRYLLLITFLLNRWEERLGVFFFLLSWTRNNPNGFWGLVTRTLLIMWCHISWNPQTARLLDFLTLAFLLLCHNSSTIQTGLSCIFGLRG